MSQFNYEIDFDGHSRPVVLHTFNCITAPGEVSGLVPCNKELNFRTNLADKIATCWVTLVSIGSTRTKASGPAALVAVPGCKSSVFLYIVSHIVELESGIFPNPDLPISF